MSAIIAQIFGALFHEILERLLGSGIKSVKDADPVLDRIVDRDLDSIIGRFDRMQVDRNRLREGDEVS